MIETPVLTEKEVARRDILVERIFRAFIEGGNLVTIYLGDRLGLYQALADLGSATSAELSARAGTHERYTREWLEQQAVAGIIDVVDVQAGARNVDITCRRDMLKCCWHAKVSTTWFRWLV